MILRLQYSLNKNGFHVDNTRTVEEAMICLKEIGRYDLLILDVTLPDGTGFEVCEKVRKQNVQIPIIFLTASDEEVNVIRGLDCGGDDYVTKPFSPKELIARIKAVTKRNGGNDTLTVGNITINNASREVMIDGELVDLTHTQFELLKLFLSNPSIALTRDKIIESIWGYDYEADDRTIDAHIKLLRSKLGKYRKSIKTIRKVGYRFVYEE